MRQGEIEHLCKITLLLVTNSRSDNKTLYLECPVWSNTAPIFVSCFLLVAKYTFLKKYRMRPEI